MMKRFILLVALMTFWQVIIPEATTNLVGNPSFEANTTGWTAAAGGAIAQSTTEQAVGLYSGKYTPTANTGDGLYYALTLAANTNYTFSVSVWGVDGIPYKIYLYDATAPAILGSPVEFTGDGTWHRQVVTASTGANTSSRIYIIKDGSASTDPFYIDAVQVEAKGYPTTYCDGDQDGCVWTAGTGTSTSSRDAQSTAGGRVDEISMAKYMGVRYALATGMPPAKIIDTEPAQSDGGDYQRTLLKPRQFQLVGKLQGQGNRTAARIDYHRKRNNLIKAFNPHGVTPSQPRSVRYHVDGKSVEIRGDYETGLQRQKAPDDYHTEDIALGLKSQDPFWQAVMGVANGDNGAVGIEGQGALSLTTRSTITNADYILERGSDGLWGAMGTGLALPTPASPSDLIYNAIVGDDGFLYVVGNFTNLGDANGDYVARWDGTDWSSLGTGLQGGHGWAIAKDSAGNIYVGGQFSSAGGVANTATIAMWDGSAWNALGTGAGGSGPAWEVLDIKVDSNDNVYVIGDFALMGGVANTVSIAMWDGAAWNALSTGLTGPALNNGNELAIDSNDDVYLGGKFTDAGGVANTKYIAKWDGAAFSSLGTNPNNYVEDLAIDSNDILYISGAFTTIFGVSANYIAKFDTSTSTTTALGTGLNNRSWAMFVEPNNNIVWAGGQFTTAGGVTSDYLARWDNDNSEWLSFGTTFNNIPYHIFGLYNGMVIVTGLFTDVPTGNDYITAYSGVEWRTIATASQVILQATDGKIYVGGGFINAGGVANADRIAYWSPSGEDWNALSTGTDGLVSAIAEAPNGDIYIGGSFSLAGGVANTAAIAYWDISASVWLPLSTGINGTVYSLAFSPDGDLYIGGLFEDAGGVADTQNLAMWDGSAFNALSAEPNSAVNSLVFNNAGTLWLGGAFTQIGSTTYDYIASYDPDADTFAALETGSNGFVNDMDFGPDGFLYIAGTFTQLGSVSCNYVGYWNGTQFFPLGSGLNNVAYAIDIDSDGQVYVGGAFTTAGGVTLPDKIALWTGSVWTSPDVNLPGDAAVEAILVTATGVFMGFDTSGSAIAAGAENADYQGDTYGYPVLTATGPGQLYRLSNLTTGHNIYFDILLEAGEVVTLDLRPGVKSFTSTFRGSIEDTILEGSDTETFFLLPGTNSISFFLDDASAEAYILWSERFQSFDSVIYLPIVSS